ncbi:MAG: tetratricopeptide repeat/protein kinase domain protein, partial [Gammaproteobacteria bacterium]|nr:tetratricopeptide repeat/protein kinase domain protein [Gammaproteobacteria bacterium]
AIPLSAGAAGEAPPSDPPAPTEFTDCVAGMGGSSLTDIQSCASRLETRRRLLLEQCLNVGARATSRTVIRACTASIEARILEGRQLSVLFANRADAYARAGDQRHSLDDYNLAIELAPDDAALLYDRGIDHAMQGDVANALKDYEAALVIDPTLVPALHKRALIYRAQGNLAGALSDYSEALRLKPKMAVLWSERGFVYLLQRNYPNAVADEDQAIRLEPNLARAYLFRGMVYGRLGESGKARNNVATAVRLDPALKRYVTLQNEGLSVTPEAAP